MRREGLLPWAFVADTTRWQRKPDTWDDADDALIATARTYRRNLWRDQQIRIEVWLEKDALAGVVNETTSAWDVALMVSRGVSSATFLHMAVEAANDAYDRHGVTSVVVLLFDYDAGGARAATSIRRHSRSTPKRRSSTGNRRHGEADRGVESADSAGEAIRPSGRVVGADAVELDAIPPDQLRALVEAEITNRIEPHAWNLRDSTKPKSESSSIASPQEASTRDRAASDRGRGGRPARGPGVGGERLQRALRQARARPSRPDDPVLRDMRRRCLLDGGALALRAAGLHRESTSHNIAKNFPEVPASSAARPHAAPARRRLRPVRRRDPRARPARGEA